VVNIFLFGITNHLLFKNLRNANAGARPSGPILAPTPPLLGPNPLSGAVGNNNDGAGAPARCAIERSPLRLPCSPPHHEYVALGLRVACPSSAALAFPSPAGRSFLFRPPGVLLSKPGGQKIAWAFVGLSHPGSGRACPPHWSFLPFREVLCGTRD
jgi:hypothetical protein